MIIDNIQKSVAEKERQNKAIYNILQISESNCFSNKNKLGIYHSNKILIPRIITNEYARCKSSYLN